MAILISNTGDKTVDTIAQRNAIEKKHDGMAVTVRDATADIAIGVGSAKYQWDALLSRWLMVWAEYMPSTVFHTEVKQITGDTVTASAAPLNGVIWSAVALDGSVILGDASVMSVTDNSIRLLDASLDGKMLRFHYASSTREALNLPDAESSTNQAATSGIDRVARAMSFL